MVQTAGQIQRPPKSTSMSSLFSPTQIKRSLPTLPGIPSSFGSASSHMSITSQQTGSANPVVCRWGWGRRSKWVVIELSMLMLALAVSERIAFV